MIESALRPARLFGGGMTSEWGSRARRSRFLEAQCGSVYSDGPGCPRLIAGLALLKHMCDLSDEVRMTETSTRSRQRETRYSPIVRMTLLSGRVLFDESLSSCASISSYFGTVVTSPFGTMCTTL